MQYKFQIDNKEKFKLKLLKYQAELKAQIGKLKEEIAFLNEKETKFNAIQGEFVEKTMRQIQELSADFEQKTLDLKDSLSISEAKCEKYELKLAEVVKSFMDEVKNFSNESAECQNQLAALQSEMKELKLNS